MYFSLSNKDVKIHSITNNALVNKILDSNETGKIFTSKSTDIGFIVGCAVYFKGPRKLTDDELENYYRTDKRPEVEHEERLIISGPHSKHDDIIRYCEYSELWHISPVDDEKTKYGFITSKGFFINRVTAKCLYQQFVFDLKKDDQITKLKNIHSLNSYHLDWHLIERYINDNYA